MAKSTTKILNNTQIDLSIRRLAFEIYEQNAYEQEIFLFGINNKGLALAKLISAELKSISKMDIHLSNLRLDPASPISEELDLDIDVSLLKNKTMIIIDDVANTGRTLFYAFRSIHSILVKKLEIAVLVDRQHKNFPVKVDYVGLSLATTLQESIDVILTEGKKEVVLN